MASFDTNPSEFIINTHSCENKNGQIEVHDYHLPLQDRYYWDDTDI